jgi:hypothetical protein
MESDMTIAIRGMDTTFGAPTLEKIGRNYYEKLSDEDKFIYFQCMEEFKRDIKTSWLLKLLCGYGDNRGKYDLGDLMWYPKIKNMIIQNHLWMKVFYIDDWAFPDKEFDNNANNLIKEGFKIKKTNGCADALFELDQDAELLQIYADDTNMPDDDDMDSITISRPHGIVEFGTQKICKTAMTLLQNDIILRVPYSIKGFDRPVAAMFFNTLQSDISLRP